MKERHRESIFIGIDEACRISDVSPKAFRRISKLLGIRPIIFPGSKIFHFKRQDIVKSAHAIHAEFGTQRQPSRHNPYHRKIYA